VIRTMKVDTGRMEDAIDLSMFATDVADYLTRKGMPFRKAHEVAGKLVRWAQKNETTLDRIPMEVYREHADIFEDNVVNLFDLRASADSRKVAGGSGADALAVQIKNAGTILAKGDV
jgi:argininosuccinate lyase